MRRFPGLVDRPGACCSTTQPWCRFQV